MSPPGSGPARPTPRRTDTSDPHASRERALKILFQADVRGVDPAQTLARLDEDASARAILDDADADVLGQGRQLLAPEDADAPPARRTAAATASAEARVPAIDGFTRTLVLGVGGAQSELDQLISRYARRWQVARMPVVDRAVLRVATYELLYELTPPAVVIDEAVRLAKSLSTEDSGRYVNAVLDAIRKELAARPRATADGDAAADTDADPDPYPDPDPDAATDPAADPDAPQG